MYTCSLSFIAQYKNVTLSALHYDLRLIKLICMALLRVGFSKYLIVLFNSYVSETERRHVVPSQAQRHILAGLASVVGGLSAPYEKASHVHERPVVNWLWATGCHPFGPFSNTSQISQILQDVALVRPTYHTKVFINIT